MIFEHLRRNLIPSFSNMILWFVKNVSAAPEANNRQNRERKFPGGTW